MADTRLLSWLNSMFFFVVFHLICFCVGFVCNFRYIIVQSFEFFLACGVGLVWFLFSSVVLKMVGQIGLHGVCRFNHAT